MAGKKRYTVKVRTGVRLRLPGRPVARTSQRKELNPARLQPSLPIPDPTVRFIGGYPQQGPEEGPEPADIAATRQAVGEALGIAKAAALNVPFGIGRNADDAWDEYRKLTEAARAKAINAEQLGTEEAPTDPTVERIRQQVRDTLRDRAWTPEERVQIAQAYREWYNRFTNGDDTERQINNWSVRAEFRRLMPQYREALEGNNLQKSANIYPLDDPGTPQNEGGFTDFLNTFIERPLIGNLTGGKVPNFVIGEDENGYYHIQTLDEWVTQISSAARDDPATAAELMTKMAAWGAYGGGTDKYVADRVVHDANGYPVAGQWTKDDQTALRQFLTDVAMQQAGGFEESWQQLLDDHALTNSTVIGGGNTYGSDSGGGGGRYYGGGGYGGGYGGASAGVSYTDSDQLKQLINAIARARLGMALTDAQVQEFVTFYHQQEAAFVSARMAGQSAMQLDAESQAAAWIESRFRDQYAAQSANSYISTLAGWLLGGGQIGSGT